jgi:hypothetical protein
MLQRLRIGLPACGLELVVNDHPRFVFLQDHGGSTSHG